jgi:hypothetical protein
VFDFGMFDPVLADLALVLRREQSGRHQRQHSSSNPTWNRTSGVSPAT